ncbi:MAG TPA: hypothetical protein PKH54_08955 [Myxococcota bacterium]|nr:hypothetical protein [Myxococcota bacterium]HOA14101.1 hypothetical protein [Myxococcota bacterium]HOD00064.1 hypothetical protein [Myxococcota bacterium]HOH77445.1 hypothetical protein [Myxococcota bacterium]
MTTTRKTQAPQEDAVEIIPHKWEFKARFRRGSFGWRSQPAIQRVKEAVAEITKVARRNPVLGAEGAVIFLERVSPALEQVDSSSGAIGTAVCNAIRVLVPIIAGAPADARTRTIWLERLFQASVGDDVAYIDILTDYWGELCASKGVASQWADDLIGTTRLALGPDKRLHGYFHGTSACLSALLTAERYDELIELLQHERFWAHKQWAVRALAARGRNDEAIEMAEACRGPWANNFQIDRICEEILLTCGRIDEAYARYGLSANRCGTNVATFMAVTRKYPTKAPAEILADLVKSTPGEEGKWFAAAKDAGLFREALFLAERSPCDPKTLTRAARDHIDRQPAFALGAGLLALYWLFQNHGYKITSPDILAAYNNTIDAAGRTGQIDATVKKINRMATSLMGGNSFAAHILEDKLH